VEFRPGLVVGVFGPTASGKTAVAAELVAQVPADVVSADSAALYRGVETLTAAPPPPTRLVGVLELDEPASVVEYQRLAHREIDGILAARRTPVVVGGTGLYFRAALSDLAPPAAPEAGEREHWERVYDRLGPDEAHEALARRDADAAARIHPNDRRRVVRALEVAAAGASLTPTDDDLWSGDTRHPTLVVGLDLPLDVLDRRIHERARAMVDAGVQQEATRALAHPLSTTAAKIMGLREAAELPPDEAVQALARSSRRLARYQRKWMRRMPGLVTLDADRPADEVANAILEMARAR
jgi:tRNA dimethylallyltransferase